MLQKKVPLYLIIFLVAIPQLSETIYIPALVDLSKSFQISANAAEYTLTIYLLGFTVGVLVWGTISDRIGRKLGFIFGLIIYLIACYGCYKTSYIEAFYGFRFIQAFGASVGSVLGQAVARDTTAPDQRGRLFSAIAMALAFMPALGPVIGGFIIQYTSWPNVFLGLVILGFIALLLIIMRLPETRDLTQTATDNFFRRYVMCARQMFKDPKVLGLGFMVGSVNGILFGYFGESPFFFIKALGMSPDQFGILSLLICLPLLLGAYLSRRLLTKGYNYVQLLLKGINLVLIASISFLILSYSTFIDNYFIFTALCQVCIFGIFTGVSMIIPNALSPALEDYGKFAGTGASLFGFYYYCIVSLMTGLMGTMHNGTLTALPTFFCLQGLLMLVVYKVAIQPQKILADL